MNQEPIELSPEDSQVLRKILGIPPEECFSIQVSTSATDYYFESGEIEKEESAA
jgi:hypothetical protein